MPRKKQRSIHMSKVWADRKRKKSPNGCAEEDEEKRETVSPAMEPQLQAQSDVEEKVNIGEDMELSHDDPGQQPCEDMEFSDHDPVQQPCIAPPSVISVQASKSQNHRSFSFMSQNRQCTCMALTFLAHLNEGLDLKTDDLDKILDKGDGLYKRTIEKLKRLEQFRSEHLSMEETPLTVETQYNRYSVRRENIEMGYMRDQGEPGRQHWWLNLKERLQCLSQNVTYALLTVSPYTIAVFRDSSGRYGLFDSHDRSDDGLPLPEWNGGKAVMMTFTHLEDLIAQIDTVNDFLHSSRIDHMQFDFMPVTFEHTSALSPRPSTMHMHPVNLHQKEPVDLTIKDESDTGHPTTKHSLQVGYEPSPIVMSNTPDRARKVNKERRRRMMRKEREAQPKPRFQRKAYMQKYMAMRSIRERTFREQQNNFKKAYANRKYRDDEEFRGKHQGYDNKRYREDEEFRGKKKGYGNKRYREDEEFKKQRKAYGKAYGNKRFNEDVEYREKVRKHMKFYMSHKCETDKYFKLRRDIRAAYKIKRRYKALCQVLLRLRHDETEAENASREAEAAKQRSLEEIAIADFQEDIKYGPTYVCTTCHRALFSESVYRCRRSKFTQKRKLVAACLTGEYVHSCDDQCGGPQACNVPEERRHEWICKNCHDALRAGRMPALAVANNLELAPIPPELSDLNVLERQLLALAIPFAKILTLPKGKQGAVLGAVVCVPSRVQTTINALPRRLGSSGLYRMKLKRRLRFKGHHLSHIVNMRKVVRGARTLKVTHPGYTAVTIDDDNDVEGQVENLPGDEVMDSCDETEMMEVADSAEALDASQAVDQDPPSFEDEQDALRPGHGLDSCLEADDIAQDMMTYGDGIFSIAPAEGNRPISYSTVPNLEAQAFPTLFPTGANTLDVKRRVRLSPSRYFNARLFNVDGRFARDQSFCFFAHFVSETHIAKNSISFQLKKGKPLTNDGRRITNKMLKDKREVERLVRSKDATRFMSPIRGTPAYWHKTMLDLFAMVRQLGPPTFFVTASAAEFRWPEVVIAIKAQQGQIVDWEKLDWNGKCDILRSNAVTTMRMFDKRVKSAYKKLVHSEALPFGRVIDWFHRIEFQARGSPHLHGLMWIEGAPVLGVDSDEKICEFADRYISCQLPDPDEDPVLYQIVLQVQMHSRNHTKSCKKGRKTCRFGFPKPPVDKTCILNPKAVDPTANDSGTEDESEANKDMDEGANQSATKTKAKRAEGIGKKQTARAQAAMAKLKPIFDMLMDSASGVTDLSDLLAKCNMTSEEYDSCLEDMRKNRVLLMKRGVKDCLVNNYNPVFLKAWNANMDIQFVLDHHIAITYMLSYISKAEHEMGELLKQVVVGIDPTQVTERDAMNQLVHTYVKNRQVSAQEAVARTCSMPLKKCSRDVIFLPTDDNAMKMSLPLSALRNKPDDSDQVWMKGYLDKYNARPKTPEFDNMCLADFASTYRVVYGQQAKGEGRLKLSDNMGTIKKREGRHAVVRYAKFSEKKEPEKFYGNLLKVYLPHRYQSTLKTQTFPTYKEFYESACVELPGTGMIYPAKMIVAENRKRFEKYSQAVEEAVEEFWKNGPVENAWANIAPENELDRMECLAEQDEDLLEEEERDNVPEFSTHEVGTIPAHSVVAPQLSLDFLRAMCRNLNQTQASVFHSVRDWCLQSVLEQNPEPFLFFVTGGAGTGKSHLIRCIFGEATRILRRLPRLYEDRDASMPMVLLSAFTGTAAYNIGGNTLHSLLKLPMSLNPPYKGLGNRLDDVRAKLGNAEIIIIDEISMVSKQLFAYVHWRLQEIKGSKKPFGGMSVLAVGDFYQLPPTASGKPLCVPEEGKPDLLCEHFEMVTLTEIMRQKDDVPYAQLLNRLRVKDKRERLSDADRALLGERLTDSQHCPKDVLHIFATNDQVDKHNKVALTRLHSDIVDIPAEDYERDEISHRMARRSEPQKGKPYKDLEDNLQIAEGAPVMITRNIDVEDGLVNGTFGKIDGVDMRVDRDGTTVTKLWLVLDKPEAGLKYRRTTPGATQVYVERMEENLSNHKVIRRQFPIKLAYACTAHKVQGMTTQSAVVSLKGVFLEGMSYVALSRTTTLQGLHIIDFDEKKIWADPKITAALESMKTASLDGVMPLLKFRETTAQAQTLTIVHHNTQSLPAHIQDLKRHHELTLSDVLCLTETHLTGSFVADSLQLDGYTMFSRNRHVSYAKLPERAEQNGGGVAVYVRDHFQASEKRYLHNVTNLEFVAVKIESPVKLLIAAVYRPPHYGNPFMENLKALLDSLEVMDHQPIVVCGDFNEDLLNGFPGPITRLLESRGYAQLIKEATTEKNTLLDHMYISRPQQCLQSGVLRTYYSYHNPVYCVLSTEDD